MAENSKIGWCDHTVNLWWGCYEVHKGCDNCYAKTMANRYHGPHVLWQQDGPRMAIKSAFNDIKRYQKMAAAAGVRYYIFMNSMSDIFEKSMPVVDFKHELMLNDKDDYLYTGEIRQKFFDIVDDCPNLIFLLLTKRPSNIRKMIPQKWLKEPRRNVMYGTSIVDQPTADTLIPQLLNVPGWHFFSMEPLVGPVDLTIKNLYRELSPGVWANKSAVEEVDWVIVGGESGGLASRPRERHLEHCSIKINSKRKNHKSYWCLSILKKGLIPIFNIVEETYADWEAIEQRWIQELTKIGYDLVNDSIGGASSAGRKLTNIHKDLISINNGNRKLSDDDVRKVCDCINKKYKYKNIKKIVPELSYSGLIRIRDGVGYTRITKNLIQFRIRSKNPPVV